MDDCIFCKIIQGDIPSIKVFEDDTVIAFLDISQTTPGHTLLVPKQHVQDIFAYDADLAAQVFQHVPRIARALRAAFPEMTGLNICNNNGEVAYQSVMHSHIHFIPRYASTDDFNIHFGDHTSQYTTDQLQVIGAKIKQQLEVN
ncbi:histidine triad nucleotide-binding protein [Lapidilactobacillus concavus DSM 17758]|uniref:Histidine triad nucleotide-binding protein n=1 Tax=Lapidilactobacillus concavus DSM 17758 TaxID=1423735 RepID=A0A0R1W6J2_9LACO|nr:HIT family protein [Lapidilactobacillus concavus]KRM11273.1 histidine triad nucleotide-binding protein [Lapidilactobacillus concavus DSM 17758]GEL13457.1 histidine triad protein [Lapidilactobacillus concavus]